MIGHGVKSPSGVYTTRRKLFRVYQTAGTSRITPTRGSRPPMCYRLSTAVFGCCFVVLSWRIIIITHYATQKPDIALACVRRNVTANVEVGRFVESRTTEKRPFHSRVSEIRRPFPNRNTSRPGRCEINCGIDETYARTAVKSKARAGKHAT